MRAPAWLLADERVAHVRRLESAPGRHAEWPDWVAPDLIAALAAQGIERPWQHQIAAAEAAFAGRHVALATATEEAPATVFVGEGTFSPRAAGST